MASTMMNKSVNLQRQPFTSGTKRSLARPSARTVVRASQDAKDQQSAKAPSDLMMKAVGAFAAVQLAFLPVSGPALAAQGKLAVEGGLDAGEAVQQAVPKGAKDPKTREDRNDARDEGLASKLNLIKERVNPDNILNSPDIESGGKQNIFAPAVDAQKPPVGAPVSLTPASSLQINVGFNAAADKGLMRLVGNPVSEKDLGRRQPNIDPLAPAADKLPISAEDAENAAGAAVEKAKDAAPSGNPLEALFDKIKGAAVTNDSPQRQLDQAASKTQEAIKSAPKTKGVSFDPRSMGSLMHTVASDMDNASFQGPQGTGGGVEQPTERTDMDLPGNPKRGGDLKDSTTDFAAQYKGDNDQGTPAQTGADASARPGANTPKGVGEIRNPKTPTLPNALGGKNFLRDDNVTPEEAASGNIAKAQQSSGNAIDSIKKGLGL